MRRMADGADEDSKYVIEAIAGFFDSNVIDGGLRANDQIVSRDHVQQHLTVFSQRLPNNRALLFQLILFQ